MQPNQIHGDLEALQRAAQAAPVVADTIDKQVADLRTLAEEIRANAFLGLAANALDVSVARLQEDGRKLTMALRNLGASVTHAQNHYSVADEASRTHLTQATSAAFGGALQS